MNRSNLLHNNCVTKSLCTDVSVLLEECLVLAEFSCLVGRLVQLLQRSAQCT